MEMSFTDPMSALIIDGPFTYIVQEYVHNIYENDEEKHFFMADGIAS
jgi:hypothetical protein